MIKVCYISIACLNKKCNHVHCVRNMWLHSWKQQPSTKCIMQMNVIYSMCPWLHWNWLMNIYINICWWSNLFLMKKMFTLVTLNVQHYYIQLQCITITWLAAWLRRVYSYIIVCLCYASLRGICLTLASFWYQLSSLTVYSGNQVYQECIKFLAWKIVDVAVYKQMKIGVCCFSSWRNMLQTNYVTCYGLLLHIQSGSLNHKVKPLELKRKCLGIIRSVK